MEKRISYSQFQSVKCVAKACDPLISKRTKLKAKIDALTKEYDDCNTQISSLEAGIVSVIGLPVEALVKKVIEPGVDVNGLPKKTTKYLPTNIVSYDEQHKQYVISTPEEPKEAVKESESSLLTGVDKTFTTPTKPTEPTTPTTPTVEEPASPSFAEELSMSESTAENTMPTDFPVCE